MAASEPASGDGPPDVVPRPPRIRILGVGMGPQHVTPEVSTALAGADYVIASAKGDQDDLLAVRREIAARHGVEVVAVPDPERDRDAPADYPGAVRAWHAERVAAYEKVIRERGGTAAFLVWGDPSLYDSTIRIVEQLADRLPAGQQPVEYDVLPGISAPQLLAARHRMVLHPVGVPVHVTTARRLPEALAAGQTNIVVMLGSGLDADLDALPADRATELQDWTIWWGANLGTGSEELLTGRVCDVGVQLARARARAKAAAGWVMDLYLLRKPA